MFKLKTLKTNKMNNKGFFVFGILLSCAIIAQSYKIHNVESGAMQTDGFINKMKENPQKLINFSGIQNWRRQEDSSELKHKTSFTTNFPFSRFIESNLLRNNFTLPLVKLLKSKNILKTKSETKSSTLIQTTLISTLRSKEISSPIKSKLVHLIELNNHNGNRGVWDDLLNLLHLLGVTNEDIIQGCENAVDWVEHVLAILPPEEVYKVELAAGNVLGILQKDQVDLTSLKEQLDIIYSVMFPYVSDDMKPSVDVGLQMLWWILEHLYGEQDNKLSFRTNSLKQ